MPEHYTRNTTGVMKFCSTCNRMTMHRVDNKRLGSCTEPHAVGMSDAQKRQKVKQDAAENEPELF